MQVLLKRRGFLSGKLARGIPFDIELPDFSVTHT
jgi:hypothetical protein